MTPTSKQVARPLARCLPLLALVSWGVAIAAPPITIANYPLFLAPSIKPNVLIMFDNSQSMDATMSGKVISGDDPATRGNTARKALLHLLDTYKDSFNWGLGSFETKSSTLFNTHAYYVGDTTTMVYTNDCVADPNGVLHSPANGGLRCIDNPDKTVNNQAYITYAQSGDDADVNDVLYSGSTVAAMYGVGDTAQSFPDDLNYFVRGAPRDAGTDWAIANFPAPGPFGTLTIPFSPTDAGWLPHV